MSDSPDLRALLAAPVQEVAPRLLGAVLSHGDVAVRITEVEAYGGADDPASHAARGRTTRNASMFDAPGTLYCYRIYGMHTCANVVTGALGDPAAVLVRAGEVVAGRSRARERRAGVSDHELARGPGNLCRALGIGLDLDGTSLLDGPCHLEAASTGLVHATSARVGVRLAPTLTWRFFLSGEPSVSRYRAAATPRVDGRPGDT